MAYGITSAINVLLILSTQILVMYVILSSVFKVFYTCINTAYKSSSRLKACGISLRLEHIKLWEVNKSLDPLY